MPVTGSDDLQVQLRRFGLRQFRPGQREVIDAVLSGADCLCIMPTGGGKSLCYQLPAVMRDGLTLVVSPLIALMKDQVDGLNTLGVQAAYVNSTLDPAEQAERMARMRDGEYDLVYVAPERLRSPRFMEIVRATRVHLLAVDEAHCISEWGHDFRPDYSRLGQFRQYLGDPQTIALTATATPGVRKDVVAQLALKSPKTFVAGFARPNLRFEVQTHYGRRDKESALVEFLREHQGAGIIYCSTRKGCEEVAQIVADEARRSSGVYHAGLENEQRRKVQEQFMAGQLEIVVATNAFGMGIDKADVRFVVHFNIPGSIAAYYQEAGRAGRDGLPATCLLLYYPSDRYIQEYFIESTYPSPEVVEDVYEYLRNHEEDPIEITQKALKDELELSISAEGVGTCERLLEKAGVLKRMEPHRNMAAVVIGSDAPTLVDMLPPQAQVQRKVLARLEQIVDQRRHELVYFQPQELARATSLGLASVIRALRELNRLQDVDYVPPFRGRAIHLSRRDLPFDRLSIDFEALHKRKQADWDKLNRIVGFATTTRCRNQEVLRYFGERLSSQCGHCDNCRTVSTEATAAASGDAVIGNDALIEAVRMTLSGVARANGRFGKNVIAAMLCGSESAKISRWKLDRLSTFGLLRDLTQPEVSRLIDSLIGAGLVEQSEVDRFRPVVQLTDRGAEVMRGESPLDGDLQIPQTLLLKLNARKHETRNERSAAPALRQARDAAAQLSPGDAATNYRSSPAGHAAEADGAETPANSRPSYYWTWKLLADGYTAQECVAIRGLTTAELLDHAVRAAESGLKVNPRWLLSQSQIAAANRVISAKPSRPISAVTTDLPKGLTYEHVLLVLRCASAPASTGQGA